MRRPAAECPRRSPGGRVVSQPAGADKTSFPGRGMMTLPPHPPKGRPAMLLFAKVVHVLALGLWFGTVLFFTFVVGLSLFRTYDALTEVPPAERLPWLPAPAE